MERNTVLNINNIIYRIYGAENMEALKKNLLQDIRMLIPCSYASILMAEHGEKGMKFGEPFCVPEAFYPAEKRYISMKEQDYLLWIVSSNKPIVIRESEVVSEEKRLASPLYQTCYRGYDVYDTLQLSMVSDNIFLGAVTLFRTSHEGAFAEEDAFLLELLGSHLSRRFSMAEAGMTKDSAGNGSILDMDILQSEYTLTKRETEILSLIFDNLSDEEIEKSIHITHNTLKKHIQNIYHKMNVSARWELMKFR